MLGADVSIGPFAVVEDGAVIGDRTVIRSSVYIGHETSIGEDYHIYPNVIIRERCVVGRRVSIHSGSVIGSDGFGYVAVKDPEDPQIGTVEIEDDVEIGSNVTIDPLREDDHPEEDEDRQPRPDRPQLRHWENSIIVAQVGISGSTTVGRNVILAGQVGVVGHVTIGDNTIIGVKGSVSRNVPRTRSTSASRRWREGVQEGARRAPAPAAAYREVRRIEQRLEKGGRPGRNDAEPAHD